VAIKRGCAGTSLARAVCKGNLLGLLLFCFGTGSVDNQKLYYGAENTRADEA
jgi:hypothetical protein